MPGLYMIRGQTYLLAGLPDKAIPDLEQVLALTEDESATGKAKGAAIPDTVARRPFTRMRPVPTPPSPLRSGT